ncbi:Allene oxide synthase, chloroplastic [Triticum urartu]|uniref:Allene oxide synthase, chloroplastic n=1 Tax=Triticum urartu TaxID=4572 RepID=M7Z8P8_TRIUA|nr:Allene oxide synthase, chloroplastic [Triticum urartu]
MTNLAQTAGDITQTRGRCRHTSATPPRRGTTPTDAIATIIDQGRAGFSSVTSHTSHPSHLTGGSERALSRGTHVILSLYWRLHRDIANLSPFLQGPEEFFRRRAAQYRSTVFRANIPPTFPFFVGVNPRVVAIVDTAAFTALFDPELVDKRDCLIGPYNPSDSFTGGTRVGVYLDTEEPEHERTKAFAMDLLRRSSRVWAPEFLEGVDGMLAAIESDLDAGKGKEGGASFLVPLQKCIFRFLCRAVASADPAAEDLVDRYGLFILDVWLGLQLVPTQKIGAIPPPLEELLLHSFPFPSILVKPGYDLLYRFLEKHGAESVGVGVKDHGMTDKDAINNILFLLGFNAFGGFSVFLPFLILQVGKDAALRARLRDEVRAALERHAGEVGFASLSSVRYMNW